MRCTICYDKPAIVNYPYEQFVDEHYGLQAPGLDSVALCAECDECFREYHIGRFTQRYVESVNRRHDIPDYSKAVILADRAFMLDMYHLFTELRIQARLKSN